MKTLILGGTSGIGEEVYRQLRKLQPEGKFELFDHDVRRDDELISVAHRGPWDQVVYSVGVNHLDWIQGQERDIILDLFDVNVTGFIMLLKYLVRANRGVPCSVVAVSSDAARRPMRTSIAYCASKAALTMAVRVASRELSLHGWRVNVVSPGKVADTPMTEYVDSTVPKLRGWTPEYAAKYENSSSPLGRPLQKSEVAEVIIQVLTSDNRAWTGADIEINGGR